METILQNKKRIGVDLDDTIWKFHESLLGFCNEKFNKNFTIEDCNTYKALENLYELTRDQVVDVLDEYEFQKNNRRLPLLPEVKELILELDKEFEIYFITARSSKDREMIQERLYEIFEREVPVFFQYDENRVKRFEKIELCLEKNIEVMIDDAIHNLVDCAENGIKCFLLDYPWNRVDGLHPNIIRVNNWKEIAREILRE